mmetsp:Transcript_96054/g.266862  ORF Transcript_96054/g.266862 Transcript_96054/m.266862 type:complete len:219 (+) Transcript_96054:1216-1872(+)
MRTRLSGPAVRLLLRARCRRRRRCDQLLRSVQARREDAVKGLRPLLPLERLAARAPWLRRALQLPWAANDRAARLGGGAWGGGDGAARPRVRAHDVGLGLLMRHRFQPPRVLLGSRRGCVWETAATAAAPEDAHTTFGFNDGLEVGVDIYGLAAVQAESPLGRDVGHGGGHRRGEQPALQDRRRGLQAQVLVPGERAVKGLELAGVRGHDVQRHLRQI